MTLNGAKVAGFNAQDFFQLGLRLAKCEPNEAGYRTAINRAYYACHLVGCESTYKKGWFISRSYDGRDHQGLIRVLRENKTRLWHKLRSLYELREHADYHIDPSQQLTSSSCKHCDGRTDTATLVDEDTWVMAREIADNILPCLQNI